MSNDVYDKYVPDDGPVGGRILLVGEAPGENEHIEGKPFVGESGMLLIRCLNRAGVNREDVRLANLCHYRPAGNKFELLLQTDELRAGLSELYKYIEEWKPTVIGALGAWPLIFLTGKKGIKKWRGSILSYIHDENIKVIPTLHPAAVLRDRTLYPIFDTDIKRIISDSAFPEKALPVRRFIIDPRGLECEEWTERLCQAEFLGTDIETVKSSSKVLCCGFAPSADLAVCFVPTHHEGRRAIERVLRSDAKKIFQFGSFDTVQLSFLNNYEIRDPLAEAMERPYFWDTLIAQHVLVPQLPRSLEYLTSVYTREPYYKTVGRGTIPDDEKGWNEKTVNKQSLYEYNCRDCCCTIEIALKQMTEIAAEPKSTQAIFQFEMEMLEVAAHISCSGMPVDLERRVLLEKVLMGKWAKKQFILDRLTGYETNVRSPKLKGILYDHMGLPTRKKQVKGKSTITTDEDAIVSLITYCKDHLANLVQKNAVIDWQVKLAICQTILEIRGIRQVLSNYVREKMKNGRPRAGSDGRIRSTYKVGGTETGRWSAMKFVDGTGFNSQTLPRDPVEIPDEALTLAPAAAILESQLEDEPDEDDEVETEEAA